MRRDRDAVQKALDRFTNPKLRTLVERGERGVKGTIEGERVGSAKGAVPRPTEGAALRGLPDDDETPDVWREQRDGIGATIREIACLLDNARVAMEGAEDRLDYLLNLKPDEAMLGEHKTAGTCRACERRVTGSFEDRLRSGYCPRCRMKWKRLNARWTDEGLPGAPDRLAFERQQRAEADREKAGQEKAS